MLPDFATIRNYDLNELAAAREDWQRISRQFADKAADYQNSVLKPTHDGSWQGPAAATGQQAMSAVNDQLLATQPYFDTVLGAIDAFSEGMASAQRLLAEARRTAEHYGVTLSDQGHVELPPPGKVDWDDPPVNGALAAQKLIYQARYMAGALDTHLVPLLLSANQFHPDDHGPWQQQSSGIHDLVQQTVTRTRQELEFIANIPDSSDKKDTAAQPYNQDYAGPGDYLTYHKMLEGGLTYIGSQGWYNAYNLLAHWLDNSGTSCRVDPKAMVDAMPSFAREVEKALSPGDERVYDSGWHNFSPGNHVESLDWYYAFNDFRFRVVGLIQSDGHGSTMTEYTIGIRKPYVFGDGRKAISVKGIEAVSQDDLKDLHTSGLAQNFIAHGVWHSGPTLKSPPGRA